MCIEISVTTTGGQKSALLLANEMPVVFSLDLVET
jgi:hypothetical protein